MIKEVKKLQQLFFILLALAIPTSVAITSICSVVLVFLWFLDYNFSYKLKAILSQKHNIFLFALIFLYSIGVFWGEYHSYYFDQIQRLSLLLLLPVLSTTKLFMGTLRIAVSCFLAANFLAAIFAILVNNELMLPFFDFFLTAIDRPMFSAFLTYNYHNILLCFSTIISIYLFAISQGKIKILYLFITFVYAISIYTEAGRAGHILFVLICIYFSIYFFRRSFLRFFSSITLLFLLLFVSYNYSHTFKYRTDSLIYTLNNNGFNKKNNVIDSRYMFFNESIKRIVDAPLIGYGSGSFGTIFKNEVDHPYKFTDSTKPHNQYLYVLFELGLCGLLLLILIFYYQIRDLLNKKASKLFIILPLSFLFIMLFDSYLFVHTIAAAYIFLFSVFNRNSFKVNSF